MTSGVALSVDAARRIRVLCERGWSNKQIARQLGISNNTVRDHRQRMGLLPYADEDAAERLASATSTARRCRALRQNAEERDRMADAAVAALIGPPYPYGEKKCCHGLTDGVCPPCEREQRRFVGFIAAPSAADED